ncbi:zinc finger protein 235-like [Planococcus citri]|uniref:zinc finger protein 235-like n=1 Tax=Planococcus citri TaxID=170843 RepID=UPI0031F96DED
MLQDCSNEALNENFDKKTSKRARSNTDDGFDLSSIPKAYVLLPRLDWNYGDLFTLNNNKLESNSFSNEHAEELCTFAGASVTKSLEVSSSDLNNDIAVKKCNSTTVLDTKEFKNWATCEPNEAPNLSQSLVCKICHKNICNKDQMRRHMFMHRGLKPFECADCGKSFARKENMQSHIFSMHMPYQSRPYKCDTCSKFYSTLGNLNHHRCSATLRNHSKQVSNRRQSAVCDICNKYLSRRRDLKRHMLIHEGLKPFKCTECDKSFRSKSNMYQHTRLYHTPYHTRLYKCDICDKRYAAQCELNAHKRLTGHYCSSKLSKFTSADVEDGVTVEERDSSYFGRQESWKIGVIETNEKLEFEPVFRL